MSTSTPTVQPNHAELLPCPFCGAAAGLGTGDFRLRSEYAFINCIECHASTNTITGADHRFTPEEATEAWNNRALVGRPTTEQERHDRMTFAAIFQDAAKITFQPNVSAPPIPLDEQARTRLLALLVYGEPELAAAARAFRAAFAGGEDAHTTEQWAALARLNRALGDPA